MSDLSEEKKKAIEELQVALKGLLTKDALPLREKAMVLAAIEKIQGEQNESTTRGE